MAEPRPAIENAPGGIDFVSDVVGCIVRLAEDGPAAGALSLPFGLNAWMKRHGVGLE